MITFLAFLVTIGVLVLVHEWGHYRMAIACGVRVERFSMGFGPVIWRRQRREADGSPGTEFVLSLLPLGGYVRFLDERQGMVPVGQLSRAFNRKPLRQRVAIVAAGPLANLILAVCLYAISNWIGAQEPKAILSTPPAGSMAEAVGIRSGDEVLEWAFEGQGDTEPVLSMSDVRWGLTQALVEGRPLVLRVRAQQGGEHEVVFPVQQLDRHELNAALFRQIGIGSPRMEAVLGDISPEGAAHKAGLQSGDKVLSVDGKPVTDAFQLRQWIRQWGPDGASLEAEKPPMQWTVERQGKTLDFAVRPAIMGEGSERMARIEAMVGQSPEWVHVQRGFWQGLHMAVDRTWEMMRTTVTILFRMVTGEASVKNLTGPLTVADVAGQSVQLGLSYYLGFLAVVSISLGVLNLMPLPMLDGGHLMYYLYEAFTGRPVPEVWLERFQRGGLVILLLIMSLAFYNDVARLLGS